MFALRYTKNLVCDMWTVVRCTTGRLMREYGLHLDQKGAIYMSDIAHLEHFNRHRNIMSLY